MVGSKSSSGGRTAGDGSAERSGRKVAVFVHIPKTAGTTLSHLLRSNEPTTMMRIANVFKGGGGFVDPPPYDKLVQRVRDERRARLLWGHCPFGVDTHMPPGWDVTYITFLREPVDRAISHYFHVLELGKNPKRQSFDDLFGDTNDQAERLTDDVPLERALNDVRFVPDNLQTRMLCGAPAPFGEVTDAMLEQAKENLRTRFAVVGLADRFDESLVLLKQRLRYPSILYNTQRVNSQRPRGDAIPAELREIATRANRYDAELYRYAQALFEDAPEFGELDYQVELLALKHARLEDAADAPLPPAPEAFAGDAEAFGWLLRARVALLVSERDAAKDRMRALESSEQMTSLKDEAATAREDAQRLKAQVLRLQGKLSDAQLARSRPAAGAGRRQQRARAAAGGNGDGEPATRGRAATIATSDPAAGRMVDAKRPKAERKGPKADAKRPKAERKGPNADAKRPKADAKRPKDRTRPKADAKRLEGDAKRARRNAGTANASAERSSAPPDVDAAA